jgi:hypothetical protein
MTTSRRGCHPVTKAENEAAQEGYYAFDPDKNIDNVNPYPEGDRMRDMFFIGWVWACSRWLDD